MEVVKKTDAYTVVKKKSGRFGVKNAKGNWINAEEKVKILTSEKLITLPKAKPAAPAEETSAE
jgi:hypothetical protein